MLLGVTLSLFIFETWESAEAGLLSPDWVMGESNVHRHEDGWFLALAAALWIC
jgi:hypothetical protein